MINNNVILVLKTFSDKEVKLFEDFLNSPFHNKNTKVIQLYSILKKFHPDYKDVLLSKKNLFQQLFGDAAFKESYVRNLYSDLNILVERFLQYIHITKNYAYEKFLIEELNTRDLTEVMRKKIKLFEKKIDADKSRDQDYFMNRIFIYDMKGFLMMDKSLTEVDRPVEILNKVKLLLVTVMESYFQLIIEEQRVKIRHDYSFLKHSLEYLTNHLNDFKDSPLLLVYYYLWKSAFDLNNKNYFTNARKLFKIHFSSFSMIDKKNIYSVFQTYCINKIDSGDISYNKELLIILLEMLNFNVISHKENLIHLNLYRNILLLCIRLKEIRILRKFISHYINYVRSESRLSMSAYSYAHLNFLQGDFEKALEMSNEINFNDFLVSANENLYFKNDIRIISLMCLYELGSFESAMSHIDAHKHFLNNSKLMKEKMRKKYIHSLNSINDLIKLKIKFDDFNLAKFKNKVLNNKEFPCAEWVLEKITEMEKQHNPKEITVNGLV